MGDCAELLLDGTLDPETGEYMGGYSGESYETNSYEKKLRCRIAIKRLKKKGFKPVVKRKNLVMVGEYTFQTWVGDIFHLNKVVPGKRGIDSFLKILINNK